MNKWEDLNAEQKSSLMKLYLKNGITSLNTMIEHYNHFSEGGPISVNTWKTMMRAKYPDIEMDNDKAGYDYDEYFKNNYLEAIKQLQNLQHFPDTYKLPNHKTFSDESIYSRGPNMGGSWSENDEFIPSVINKQIYPDIYKKDRPYTEEEIYSHKFSPGGSIFDQVIKKAQEIKQQNTDNSFLGRLRREQNLVNRYHNVSYNQTSDSKIAQTQKQNRQVELQKRYDEQKQNFVTSYGRSNTESTEAAIQVMPYISEAAKRYFNRPLRDILSGEARAIGDVVDIGTKTSLYFTPGISSVAMALDANKNIQEGDYGLAAVNGLFSLMQPFGVVNKIGSTNNFMPLEKQVANALRKEINNRTINISPTENTAHNRFRLGDVEINDPNLMYRQTDGRALGEVASGGNRHTMFNRGSLWYGIPTESMLNPVIEPKTVGLLKLTKPNSEVAKTHLLVTRNADMTGANQKFGRVSIGPHSESSLHLNIEKSPEDRWLNEMIREWRNKNSEPGVATYVTDGGSRRVPLEGALNNSNTSIYTFDSGYGYRRIQEPTPTLDQAYIESLKYNALENKSNQLLYEYNQALNNKKLDMQKIQEIVDEYGNTQYKLQTGKVNIIPEYLRNIKNKSRFGNLSLDFYHGSDANFDIFSPIKSEELYFLSPYFDFAKGFGKNVKRYRIFGSDIEPNMKSEDIYTLMGVKDKIATKGNSNLEFIVGHPSRIKSAEPIEYDLNGNIIPLENRFLFYNWNTKHKLGGKLK